MGSVGKFPRAPVEHNATARMSQFPSFFFAFFRIFGCRYDVPRLCLGYLLDLNIGRVPLPVSPKTKGVVEYLVDFSPHILLTIFSLANILIILYFYRQISHFLQRLIATIPPNSLIVPHIRQPFSTINLNEPDHYV